MHNNLPFKPLLITVALASLFPMGVASASTFGIHANSKDLIIEDQNTFENVDYGVAAENGHTATINSAGDLTFTVKKAGAYIKNDTTGSVIINAGNTLTINGSDNKSVAGLWKLFKNPRAKPDGTKMFCSAFLNDARMCCFFANAIVKY